MGMRACVACNGKASGPSASTRPGGVMAGIPTARLQAGSTAGAATGITTITVFACTPPARRRRS
jgi:hypothetical protein